MPKPRKIVEEMSEFPFRAEPGMSTEAARTLMRKAKVRHLPVVEHEKLVGVISDRDLKLAEGFEDGALLTVSDVMSRDVYQVTLGTPLADVTRQMHARKVGSAVVTNAAGRVAGIFTVTDALALLTRLLEESDEPEAKFAPIEGYLSPMAGFA
ncbi:MAG: CBS domain-containing protein [Bdellovibrionales bacterium]|nr:CBS domain-containing protein [Bdellovibrionales bacterium]